MISKIHAWFELFKSVAAWVWGCIVGLVGMVTTGIYLWNTNVASPKDVSQLRTEIIGIMDSRKTNTDIELKNLTDDIHEIKDDVKWLARNRPKE